MFEKLNELLDRFSELEEAISQPEIIRDFEKYQALLKERSSLQPLVDKYHEYLSLDRQLQETRNCFPIP